MVSHTFARAAALAAACGLAAAQTAGMGCDRAKQSCPPNIPFGGEVSYDFSTASSLKDLESFWTVDGGIKFGDPSILTFDKAAGAKFTISKDGQAATLISKNWLFFGKVEVTLQASPGKGIVTAVTLLSDSLDELDWEWVGVHNGEVETNYYHNDPNDHTNARTIKLAFNPEATTHTYTIDWTPTYITWSIDGQVVRTAKPADSPGKWPQTPAKIWIGTWCGGCHGFDGSPGTQEWAGGRADWQGAPYTAIYKSIKVTDYGGGYSGATEYVWEDLSGDWHKIKAVGGTQRDMPSAPGGGQGAEQPGKGDHKGDHSSTSTGEPTKSSTTGAGSSPTGADKPKNPPVDGGNSTNKPTGNGAPSKTTTGGGSGPTGAASRNLVSLAGVALMGLAYVV